MDIIDLTMNVEQVFVKATSWQRRGRKYVLCTYHCNSHCKHLQFHRDRFIAVNRKHIKVKGWDHKHLSGWVECLTCCSQSEREETRRLHKGLTRQLELFNEAPTIHIDRSRGYY